MLRLLIALIIITSQSCNFEAVDPVEFRGLDNNNSAGGGGGGTVISSITAIDVDQNQIIISGENLDLVSEISILGEMPTSTSPLVMRMKL